MVHGDPRARPRVGAVVTDLRIEHVRVTLNPMTGLLCLRRRNIAGLWLCRVTST